MIGNKVGACGKVNAQLGQLVTVLAHGTGVGWQVPALKATLRHATLELVVSWFAAPAQLLRSCSLVHQLHHPPRNALNWGFLSIFLFVPPRNS